MIKKMPSIIEIGATAAILLSIAGAAILPNQIYSGEQTFQTTRTSVDMGAKTGGLYKQLKSIYGVARADDFQEKKPVDTDCTTLEDAINSKSEDCVLQLYECELGKEIVLDEQAKQTLKKLLDGNLGKGWPGDYEIIIKGERQRAAIDTFLKYHESMLEGIADLKQLYSNYGPKYDNNPHISDRRLEMIPDMLEKRIPAENLYGLLGNYSEKVDGESVPNIKDERLPLIGEVFERIMEICNEIINECDVSDETLAAIHTYCLLRGQTYSDELLQEILSRDNSLEISSLPVEILEDYPPDQWDYILEFTGDNWQANVLFELYDNKELKIPLQNRQIARNALDEFGIYLDTDKVLDIYGQDEKSKHFTPKDELKDRLNDAVAQGMIDHAYGYHHNLNQSGYDVDTINSEINRLDISEEKKDELFARIITSGLEAMSDLVEDQARAMEDMEFRRLTPGLAGQYIANLGFDQQEVEYRRELLRQDIIIGTRIGVGLQDTEADYFTEDEITKIGIEWTERFYALRNEGGQLPTIPLDTYKLKQWAADQISYLKKWDIGVIE